MNDEELRLAVAEREWDMRVAFCIALISLYAAYYEYDTDDRVLKNIFAGAVASSSVLFLTAAFQRRHLLYREQRKSDYTGV